MLLFGHIGYTLAAGLLINYSLVKNRNITNQEKRENPDTTFQEPVLKGPSAKYWTLIKKTKSFDLRFLILGSLLPDIIDKPVGRYFFSDVYGSGLIYCHTLMFVIILALIGFIIKAVFNKFFFLLLAFGSFVHHILDFLWLEPDILLWPLFGFNFPKGEPVPFVEWLWGLVVQAFQRPWIAVPELIGAIITLWFVWLLYHQRKIRSFIIKGKIE